MLQVSEHSKTASFAPAPPSFSMTSSVNHQLNHIHLLNGCSVGLESLIPTVTLA